MIMMYMSIGLGTAAQLIQLLAAPFMAALAGLQQAAFVVPSWWIIMQSLVASC